MDKQGNSICDWKKWRYLGVCLMMCLWTGCSETMDAPDPNGRGMFLNYNNSDGFNEGAPQTVQWVVFAGDTESSKKYVSSGKLDAISGKIPIRGGLVLNDIYTVVNPDAELSAALADVGTHAGSEMESLKLVKLMSRNLPADASDPKVQRYHCYQNVCVQNNGTITYGKEGNENINAGVGISQSEYPMAKLHVEFAIPNEAAMTFNGEKLVIRNIQVKGPDYSYLLPGKKYDGGAYSVKACPGLTPCEPVAMSYNTVCEMLIPEYLRASAADPKATLIIMADRYKNGVNVGSAKYEMPVGNAIAQGANSDDYDINRSKVYKFVFNTISGGGTSVDNWRVDKRVDNWKEQNVPTDVEEANGLFLETTFIDNFRSFRLPRYVRFKSTGIGRVEVDSPKNTAGITLEPNDFNMQVVWDDATHKSGLLSLQKGNWRIIEDMDVFIKLKANNIEKTLNVKVKPTRFALTLLPRMNWCAAMNYTESTKSDFSDADLNDDRLIEEYSKAGGTGCANYFEGKEDDPLTGKGCWRVATIREDLLYMKNHNLEPYILWAYELASSSSYASFAAITDSKTAPIRGLTSDQLYHPDNKYFKGYTRVSDITSGFEVLCVLDDKLEKYYNIGVNAHDNPADVSYNEAVAICQNLREGNHSDWRLPTPAESAYAITYAGTQGIPNNFDKGVYWLVGGIAAGIDFPSGTQSPPGGVANVRCVREKWSIAPPINN